jgi:3-isopropylmalate dehydrogenase
LVGKARGNVSHSWKIDCIRALVFAKLPLPQMGAFSMDPRRRIAVVPGDGIGPEVIDQGLQLLKSIDAMLKLNLQFDLKDWGAEKWIKEKVGLPHGALEDLRANYDAIYFGALGDPRIPDMAHGREILLGMRFGLDLYANVRPIKLLHDKLGVLSHKSRADIDFVVVRENTEDCYVSMGGNFKRGTLDEVAIDESIHTRKGVERVIRFAFELASQRPRKHVTLGDKSNAVRFGGALWQSVFKTVGEEFPHVKADHLFVDVMAMEMVRAPERFDVIVTSNLFGDILTDLGAGISGGLGVARSSSLHKGQIGLFEPIHGSAPDIAGKGIANPMAAMLTAGSMLTYLGVAGVESAIEKAVCMAIDDGFVTPDLKGNRSTEEVGTFMRKKTCELL